MRGKGGKSIAGKGGEMAQFIDQPIVIEAINNKPKIIEEYIGTVNSGTKELSLARMRSPSGWLEPGQTPEFSEYTVSPQRYVAGENKEPNVSGSSRVRLLSSMQVSGCNTVLHRRKVLNI